MAADEQPDSVTAWGLALRLGDRDAVGRLWERFFQPLVRLAQSRLRDDLARAKGPEDVALDAFLEVCDQLARSDGEPYDRRRLWGLLACVTIRHAFDFNRHEGRRREVVAGPSVLGPAGFDAVVGDEPSAEFALAVNDLLDQLGDDRLRRVARLKMAGHANEEIAQAIDRSVSSVERDLKAIKAIWKARQAEV